MKKEEIFLSPQEETLLTYCHYFTDDAGSGAL